MLQQDTPEDFVIATGESHSVREFVERAFHEVGVEVVWEGSGPAEVGKDVATGRVLVNIDPRYYRPTEVESLQGDATKANQKLGWHPKITFDQLVKQMIAADLQQAQKDHLCQQQGFKTFNHTE